MILRPKPVHREWTISRKGEGGVSFEDRPGNIATIHIVIISSKPSPEILVATYRVIRHSGTGKTRSPKIIRYWIWIDAVAHHFVRN